MSRATRRSSPPWREHPDARERDRRYDHIAHLRQQLQLLRDGRLLREPGVSYERLEDLDERIVELTDRRDRAQRALDAHLRTAEQLLSEMVTK
jgi:hypothetical protein